jgi:hypothetical protein
VTGRLIPPGAATLARSSRFLIKHLDDVIDVGVDGGRVIARGSNAPSSGVRQLSRTSVGVAQDIETGLAATVQFKDLSSGAARLVRQLSSKSRVRIKSGSGVHVDDLQQASMYLNRELGVAMDSQSRLVVVRGSGTQVRFRGSDRPLVHTHPVFRTKPTHFATDIANADEFVEAVVDWSGSVTHFNRSGIVTSPSVSPINNYGYVYRR